MHDLSAAPDIAGQFELVGMLVYLFIVTIVLGTLFHRRK